MKITNIKHSEDEIREYCLKAGIEYIGGYTGSDCNITVKLNCGHITQKGWRSVRRLIYSNETNGTQYKSFYCSVCQKEIDEERQKIKAREKVRAKFEKESKIKTKQLVFSFCEICGQPHINRGVTCSEACRRKRVNQIHERSKRMRKANGWHKDSITWQMLYRKQKGICYLCGKVCDPNDYKIVNGSHIVGKNYPTVEHIIPISKGGSDTFENCSLACFSCNSKKGARYAPNV